MKHFMIVVALAFSTIGFFTESVQATLWEGFVKGREDRQRYESIQLQKELNRERIRRSREESKLLRAEERRKKAEERRKKAKEDGDLDELKAKNKILMEQNILLMEQIEKLLKQNI